MIFGETLLAVMLNFTMPALPTYLSDGTDLDRLASAVAVAESGGCTRMKYNNCHGIMTFPGGRRRLKRYASTDESHEDFKDLWQRLYGRYPDRQLAVMYTGNDRADIWLAHVNSSY